MSRPIRPARNTRSVIEIMGWQRGLEPPTPRSTIRGRGVQPVTVRAFACSRVLRHNGFSVAGYCLVRPGVIVLAVRVAVKLAVKGGRGHPPSGVASPMRYCRFVNQPESKPAQHGGGPLPAPAMSAYRLFADHLKSGSEQPELANKRNSAAPHRLAIVPWHAPTSAVHDTKAELAADVALVGCPAKPSGSGKGIHPWLLV